MRHGGLWLAALLTASGCPRGGAGGAEGSASRGDVGQLSCRVTKVEAVSRGTPGSILTIEVRNGGDVAAEPVLFELRGRARRDGSVRWPRLVRRVPDPVFGRAGRLVGPRQTLTYPLAVGLPSADLSGLTVRVAIASFPTATGSQSPPAEVGTPRTERVPDEAGVPVWETRVPIKSTVDVPCDVVILAVGDHPEGVRLLLQRRLAPRESAEWTVREAPIELESPDAPRLTGLALRRLSLVDWSVVQDPGTAEATDLLVQAWARWVRWTDPVPGLRGRWTRRAMESVGGAHVESTGAFRMDASGEVECVPDSPFTPEARRAILREFQEAFADLRRPVATELLARLQPTLVERTGSLARVRVGGPLLGASGPAEVHRIEDGVFRGFTLAEGGDAVREVWTTQARAGGYVVTARDLYQRAFGGGQRPSDARRWTYQDLGGRLVPVRYARTEAYGGDPVSDVVLELDGLALEGELAPAAPVDAPAALRAAWDAPYRPPSKPARLTARFVAENPGTDAIWLGERKVTGTLVLDGYAGMQAGARTWSRAVARVDGDHSEEKRRWLGEALLDRLRIWAHRDFGGRGTFDEVFRGALITERTDTPGTYDVTNGPCRAIRVEEGRVAAWDAADLLAGDLTYAMVAGQAVHVGTRFGGASSRVEVVDAGHGWIVPVRMRFERVFGPDWGPETVELRNVVVTP